MSNARKKVIVRRFAGDTIAGYLPLSGFVRGQRPDQVLDLLDLAGRILDIPLKDIKTVNFVRDFNLTDTVNPERLSRKAFLARPRNEGVWIRLTFRSGDILEGLSAPDLIFADSLIEDSGFHLAPPDARANTQRIFVPRSSVTSLQIVAVITNPSRIKPLPAKLTHEQQRKVLQESLFHAPTPPNTRPN